MREVRQVLPLPLPHGVGGEVERGARGRHLARQVLKRSVVYKLISATVTPSHSRVQSNVFLF